MKGRLALGSINFGTEQNIRREKESVRHPVYLHVRRHLLSSDIGIENVVGWSVQDDKGVAITSTIRTFSRARPDDVHVLFAFVSADEAQDLLADIAEVEWIRSVLDIEVGRVYSTTDRIDNVRVNVELELLGGCGGILRCLIAVQVERICTCRHGGCFEGDGQDQEDKHEQEGFHFEILNGFDLIQDRLDDPTE